jgi:hypothetical protein
MKKILLLALSSLFLLGCPQSHLDSDWRDSNLTKQKYIKNNIQRTENSRKLKSFIDKILSPEW